MRAAIKCGVSPDDYAEWSDRARGLVEAVILKDAETNQYGIPWEQARDIDLGFDVKWVKDYSVEAVEASKKAEFGKDGPPHGVHPVVSVNQKALARVQLQRSASKALDDDAGDAEREADRGE